MMLPDPIIQIKDLATCIHGQWIHKDLNLTIQRGEICALVGGSGSGKTTLLREILGLSPPTAGSIHLFGQDIRCISSSQLSSIQSRLGVLFQQNALFSSLTVQENISFPLREHTLLDPQTIAELAILKMTLAGLPAETATKYPAELSGGMQKRAALARAIIMDPELIFLDEPTAGLDPYTAGGLDELIVQLQATMGLTIVIVTHDCESLWAVTDRVAFLGEGRVLHIAHIEELIHYPHPLVKKFFNRPRKSNKKAH